VPITNSLAFLFTVLGEWWAEKKVISRGRLTPFWQQRPILKEYFEENRKGSSKS
jgi:hypothetical protein